MLKTSLITLGLIIAGTTLASAQTYTTVAPDGNWGAQQMPVQEGRSVYVEPPANAYAEPGLRLGSFSRETQREEEDSNAPAH